MTADELKREVRALTQTTGTMEHSTRWYLFGSALIDPHRAADIDLLIICPDHLAAVKIRSVLRDAHLIKPLDLSILTEEEETEIGFVVRQGCVQVFP